MSNNVRRIARYAIILALIFVAYAIDAAISMIGLPIRIAIVTLIMVMTILQQFNLFTSIYTATCFGLTSFLFAYFAPNITSSAFRNPLISILPRMIIGVTSYFTFIGMNKLLRLKTSIFVSNILPRAVAGGVGVLTNTVLVITMISIFAGQDVLQSVIQIIIGINFLVEILAGIFIVPTVSYSISKPLKRLRI